MTLPVRGTTRTRSAIQRADALPRNEVNGIPKNSTPPSAPSSTTYVGPFAVVKKNDTTITIKAYDGSTYLSHNYIIAGLERVEVSSDTDVTITTAGSVYIKVIVSGGVYTPTFHNAATLPAQAVGEYYASIASVLFPASVIGTILQIQKEEIHIEGRLV